MNQQETKFNRTFIESLWNIRNDSANIFDESLNKETFMLTQFLDLDNSNTAASKNHTCTYNFNTA